MVIEFPYVFIDEISSILFLVDINFYISTLPNVQPISIHIHQTYFAINPTDTNSTIHNCINRIKGIEGENKRLIW